MLSLLPMIAVAVGLAPPENKNAASAPVAVKSQPISEGLWPSPRLMDLMLARWADELADDYELDETQQTKVREAVAKRWGPYFNENRNRIQPLVNEFLEIRLDLEPPSKERLQQWAQKALPMLDSFGDQIGEAKTEFRKILTPAQRVEFELRSLQFGAGMKVARQRLIQLESGEFDPETIREFWQPTAMERKRRRTEREALAVGPPADKGKDPDAPDESKDAEASADAKPASDQIAEDLKRWDRYVAEFVRIYGLDDGQRNAVTSCLMELKQRALDHRDRRREDITRLEERIAAGTYSDEELAGAKKQLTELYGPIDEMFLELQRRIKSVPTAKQRAAVASGPADRPPASPGKP